MRVNDSLTELTLCANNIGNAGAAAIADALYVNGSLTSLNLMLNYIGEEGGVAIAEALKVNGSLTKLNLEGNELRYSLLKEAAHPRLELEL